ncbi:hypothetical protein N8482_03570 [Chitinophagales bacterium]|nr:hypothetical protein [Chitinophagales bacterium]
MNTLFYLLIASLLLCYLLSCWKKKKDFNWMHTAVVSICFLLMGAGLYLLFPVDGKQSHYKKGKFLVSQEGPNSASQDASDFSAIMSLEKFQQLIKKSLNPKYITILADTVIFSETTVPRELIQAIPEDIFLAFRPGMIPSIITHLGLPSQLYQAEIAKVSVGVQCSDSLQLIAYLNERQIYSEPIETDTTITFSVSSEIAGLQELKLSLQKGETVIDSIQWGMEILEKKPRPIYFFLDGPNFEISRLQREITASGQLCKSEVRISTDKYRRIGLTSPLLDDLLASKAQFVLISTAKSLSVMEELDFRKLEKKLKANKASLLLLGSTETEVRDLAARTNLLAKQSIVASPSQSITLKHSGLRCKSQDFLIKSSNCLIQDESGRCRVAVFKKAGATVAVGSVLGTQLALLEGQQTAYDKFWRKLLSAVEKAEHTEELLHLVGFPERRANQLLRLSYIGAEAPETIRYPSGLMDSLRWLADFNSPYFHSTEVMAANSGWLTLIDRDGKQTSFFIPDESSGLSVQAQQAMEQTERDIAEHKVKHIQPLVPNELEKPWWSSLSFTEKRRFVPTWLSLGLLLTGILGLWVYEKIFQATPRT